MLGALVIGGIVLPLANPTASARALGNAFTADGATYSFNEDVTFGVREDVDYSVSDDVTFGIGESVDWAADVDLDFAIATDSTLDTYIETLLNDMGSPAVNAAAAPEQLEFDGGVLALPALDALDATLPALVEAPMAETLTVDAELPVAPTLPDVGPVLPNAPSPSGPDPVSPNGLDVSTVVSAPLDSAPTAGEPERPGELASNQLEPVTRDVRPPAAAVTNPRAVPAATATVSAPAAASLPAPGPSRTVQPDALPSDDAADSVPPGDEGEPAPVDPPLPLLSPELAQLFSAGDFDADFSRPELQPGTTTSPFDDISLSLNSPESIAKSSIGAIMDPSTGLYTGLGFLKSLSGISVRRGVDLAGAVPSAGLEVPKSIILMGIGNVDISTDPVTNQIIQSTIAAGASGLTEVAGMTLDRYLAGGKPTFASGILPELFVASFAIPATGPAIEYLVANEMLPTPAEAKTDPLAYYKLEFAQAATLGAAVSLIIGSGQVIRGITDGKSFVQAFSGAVPTYKAALINPAVQKICSDHWSGKGAPVSATVTAATDVTCGLLMFGEPVTAILTKVFPPNDKMPPPAAGGASVPADPYTAALASITESTNFDAMFASLPALESLMSTAAPSTSGDVTAAGGVSKPARDMMWVGNELTGRWVSREEATQGTPVTPGAGAQPVASAEVALSEQAALKQVVVDGAAKAVIDWKKQGVDLSPAQAIIASQVGVAYGLTPEQAVTLAGFAPVDQAALRVTIQGLPYQPPTVVIPTPTVPTKSPAEIRADQAIAYFHGQEQRIKAGSTPPPAVNPSPQPTAPLTATTPEPAAQNPRETTQVPEPQPVAAQPWWTSLTTSATGTLQSLGAAVEWQKQQWAAGLSKITGITGSDINIETYTASFNNGDVGVYLPTGERVSGSGPTRVNAGDLTDVYNRTLRTKLYPASAGSPLPSWVRMPIRY